MWIFGVEKLFCVKLCTYILKMKSISVNVFLSLVAACCADELPSCLVGLFSAADNTFLLMYEGFVFQKTDI